jgi:hypothetical protein
MSCPLTATGWGWRRATLRGVAMVKLAQFARYRGDWDADASHGYGEWRYRER